MDKIIEHGHIQTFFKRVGNEVVRMDISTYDTSCLYGSYLDFTYTKNVLIYLTKHIVKHIMQPEYKDKNFFFELYLKDYGNEFNNFSRAECTFVWTGDHSCRSTLFNSLTRLLYNLKEIPLWEGV